MAARERVQPKPETPDTSKPEEEDGQQDPRIGDPYTSINSDGMLEIKAKVTATKFLAKIRIEFNEHNTKTLSFPKEDHHTLHTLELTVEYPGAGTEVQIFASDWQGQEAGISYYLYNENSDGCSIATKGSLNGSLSVFSYSSYKIDS